MAASVIYFFIHIFVLIGWFQRVRSSKVNLVIKKYYFETHSRCKFEGGMCYLFFSMESLEGEKVRCRILIAWKVSKYGEFFGLFFLLFRLNTEIYSVNLCSQSKYRKIQTRKNGGCDSFQWIFTPAFHLYWAKMRISLLF